MPVKVKNKPSNKHIEKDANGIITKKLRNLFLTKNLELGENSTSASQDWGTDFYIEVLNRDKKNKREMLFLLQCKGMDKSPKILKTENYFSFTMSLRHANYFYFELSEPLIFIVCDIKTEDVYWYAVQLDTTLKNRIVDQVNSKRKTLQIKIPAENILNEDNFERLLTDIGESQKAQLHKKKEQINLKANYSKVNDEISNLNIIDGLIRLTEIFAGINVFPQSIINKLKVFTGSEGSLYGETLSTDNEKFYDFLDNLIVDDNIFLLKNKNVEYAGVDEFQKKVRHIISFLRVNWITHVTWKGKSNLKSEKICVHNLFVSKGCDCERCSYSKLNFPRAVELLKSDEELIENEFRLRKAYTFYLMADMENSYKEHKKIIDQVSIGKTPGIYIVAKYNLLQLKRMVDWQYFGESRNEILRELKNETFALDEILMPEHYIDIFKQISENRFVNNTILDIDNKLTDIRKQWYSDQFGGSSTNSYARNLIIEFLRSYNFVEYNHLIYNEYREFEVLANKMLEGILALYAINNPASSKYEHFGYTIINMWLFHAEPSHIKHLLRRYDIKVLDLEFSDIEYDILNEYISNLINSSSIIYENFKKENYTHNDKIRKLLQNYLLILAVINLTQEQKNNLLGKYLILVDVLGEWYFTAFDYLDYYVHYNDNVSCENLERIIILIKKYEQFHHDIFPDSIKLICENFEEPYQREMALKQLLEIDEFSIDDFIDRNKFSDLPFLFNLLTVETKTKLKDSLTSKLNDDFDSELFYLYSILDVLDFNPDFLKQFVELTPDYTFKKTGHEFMSGRKERKNYHLDKVLNLMFKFDLAFTPEIKALSNRAIDKNYYDWIMDIDGFDYSKFNSYWILYYKTESYFKAFKKSEKLKYELRKALKNKYIEGVAKILISNFD
ncbi:MAG TPA: DUF4365 domain-containing protein [Flavobacterium sp.]|uniref:DUF4365 domain-containing protein n=2 Tax=Flavobacterium TaxID=237 RepID=UPI0025C34FDF|nr:MULTISPECIES: DUF4365 domain-containing protein [unclassified Flavobacterium]HRE76295.1 DUF4365 domain-containing protein [Flavobacterium sp.]